MTRGLAVAVLAAGAAATAACLPRPRPTPPVLVYDFGPAPAEAAAPSPAIPIPVIVRPPEAPLWVDSPAISYRLAYEDAARIRSYAYSTWVSSPVRLLGDLLRRRIALATAAGPPPADPPDRDGGLVLHTTIEEFSQVFDTRDTSRVVLRARVAVERQSDRKLAAQQTFTIERKAPTPDASGAVHGFGEASRELVDRVVVWLSETALALARAGPREALGP